jgi:hypothetical protein
VTTSSDCSLGALAAAVEQLLARPRAELTVQQLQEVVLAVTPLVGRLDGWLRATEGELSARCDGRVPTDGGTDRSVVGWLAEARRESPSSAGSRLRTARLLRDELPLVSEAVLQGVLTAGQAHVLTRLVGKIDSEALRESQESLIAVAAPLDPVQLGAWVSDKIASFCEPALEADERNGQARRFLQTSREADGALRGRFVLSREDSEPFLTLLEPLARKQELSDTRTAGQRRADALVEVFEQVLRAGELGDAGGLRPQLSYVVPAGWAADEQGRASCTDCGPRCAVHTPIAFSDSVRADLPAADEVVAEAGERLRCATAAWSGPQTRSRIEALLCDARISRVLLDAVGQVRGLESLRESITPNQRRALAARDQRCAARGCRRPPAMCDAHHLQARADGGATCLDNLVLLCRRHHVLWHQGRITYADLRIRWHDAAPPPPTGRSPGRVPPACDDELMPTAS